MALTLLVPICLTLWFSWKSPPLSPAILAPLHRASSASSALDLASKTLVPTFARSDSCTFKGIIYARYRIPINYCIAVENSVDYANYQFPGFLVDILDGVIVLRWTGLYPALL